MHQINDITLNIDTESHDFSKHLYSNNDHFWSITLFDVINDVFDGLDIQNEEIVINELSIDLGEIAAERFNTDFPQLVHEKLREEIIKLLHRGDNPNMQRTQIVYKYLKLYQKYLTTGLWSKELADCAMKPAEILHLLLNHYFSELKKTLLSSENKHVIPRFASELNPELLSLFITKLFPFNKENSLTLKLPNKEHKAKLISWLLANEDDLKNSTQSVYLEDMIQSSVNQITRDIDNVVLHREINISSYKNIFEIIDNNQAIYNYRNQIFKCLSNSSQLELLIDTIHPNQNEKLIIGLYTVEAKYILPFFREMTMQANDRIVGVSKFNKIKSLFIYTILFELRTKVFNKKYFVQQLIHRLGAHYDVSKEAITQIMIEEMSKIKYLIPYQILGILQDLDTTALKSSELMNVEESLNNIGETNVTNYTLSKIINEICSYEVVLELENFSSDFQQNSITYLQCYINEFKIIFQYLYKQHQIKLDAKMLIALFNSIEIGKKETGLKAVFYHLQSILPSKVFNLLTQYIIKYHKTGRLSEILKNNTKLNTSSTINLNSKTPSDDSIEQNSNNQTASKQINKTSLEETYSKISSNKHHLLLQELDNAVTAILGYTVHWEYNDVPRNVTFKNASYLQRYQKELQVIFHYLYKQHQHQFQSKELMELLKILLQKNQTFVHSIQAVINYLEKQLPNQIFQSWMQYIETNEQKHPILETINEQQISTKDEAVETITTVEPDLLERTLYQVNHAGIVLLAPYLPMLFAKLDLTESGQLKNQTAQIKAVAVLAYVVNTQLDERTCNEPIHKILVGLPTGIHITSIPELTDIDIAIMNSLLDNAAQQWAVIKTKDALREAFLERGGQLYITDDFYQLTPEPKAYDMLLDSIPWSYKTTKFSWMDKPIITNWR